MGQNPGDQQPNDGQSAQGGQSGQQGQQAGQTGHGQQSGQASQEQQAGQAGQPAQGENATQQRDTSEQIASWFTETMVRTVVAIFGVALVLLALGQIAGVPLLEIVADFITSGIGAWVLIAFFGMLLLVAASKSWNISNQ